MLENITPSFIAQEKITIDTCDTVAVTAPLPQEKDMREAALYYKAIGWHVFPVHSVINGRCTCGKVHDKPKEIGKHPATAHGYKDATTDTAKITAWFSGSLRNIGVATGEVSKVFVVDIDGQEGEENLRLLQAQYGALPITLSDTTGRGRHLYFQYPKDSNLESWSRNDLGIDCRANKGYAIVPPSCHVNGNVYVWIEFTAIAEAPPWIIEFCRTEGENFRARPLNVKPDIAPNNEVMPNTNIPAHLRDLRTLNIGALVASPAPWSEHEERRLFDALSKIPPVGNDVWFTVACALKWLAKFWGSDLCLKILDDWSRLAPDHYAPQKNFERWKSLPLNHSNPITLASIFRLAKQNGWQDTTTIPVASPTALSLPSSGQWPKPTPIREALRPVVAFDAESLLPDALRGWVMDEANRMPCPPDFVAAGVIVALGSIIGARCAVKPKKLDDWLVVPNLWGGIVALPSAKKSPAIGAALKPLDRLAAKAIEKHQTEIGLYDAQKTVHEAKEKDIKNRIVKLSKNKSNNGESFAQELVEHRQQSPAAPNLKRYKTNDTTVEKLGELLRDNPSGLLVLRDELVGLIASWDKDGREGDRAFFLEAWNGNASFDTDRIGRGSILIPNLCASIFGGIQPDKLMAYLEQASSALENDGMLQRFQILVYPDPYPWEYRDRTPNKQLRDKAYDVFEKLATTEPANWGAHVQIDYVKFPYFFFSPEAQDVFVKFSEKLHRGKIPAEATPIIQQHLAKYDKLFPALALILHLVECAATGQRGAITKEAALRAEAWCEYLETHARRCYGLLADRNMRAAQALAQKISQGDLQDGFTARDVNRKKWRSLTSVEIVEAALDTLEDEGWVMSQEVNGTGPGGGRRTFRYFINPKAVQSPKLKDGGN